MSTDFTYSNTQIVSTGPIKPSGRNVPSDPRIRVETYADIALIPTPYIGMPITVLEDETNSNKMTDYKVLSLKADNLGVANSVIDQVQRYVDYLGSGSGLTTEQEQQLTTAYNHSQNDTEVIPMTQSDYNSLSSSEKTNKIYVITDAEEEEYSLKVVGNTLQLLKNNTIVSTVILPESTSSEGEVFGEILSSRETLTVKGGTTSSTTFGVYLSQAPSNEEIITVSSETSGVTVSPASLTFDSTNYSTQQTVTVNITSDVSAGDYTIALTNENVTTKNIALKVTDASSNGITSITNGLAHSYDFSRGSGTDTTLSDLTGDCNIILNNFTFEEGETQNCGWNSDGSLSVNNSSSAYASIDTANGTYGLTDNSDFTIAFKAQMNGYTYLLTSGLLNGKYHEFAIGSVYYGSYQSVSVKVQSTQTPAPDASLQNDVPFGTTDVFVVKYVASTRTISIQNSTKVLGEAVLDEGTEVRPIYWLFSGNYHAEFRQNTNKIYKLALYNTALSSDDINTLISELS